MPFSAPVLTYRAKGLASNIQSKVLKVHNTLININITAILAPEMTYTPIFCVQVVLHRLVNVCGGLTVRHNYTPFCKFCPIPIRIFYPEKPSIPVTNAATVYILNCCECIVRPLNPSLVTGWTCNIAHVCLA